MATAAEFKTVRELFAKLTFGQVKSLLEDALEADDQEGVRHWLAGDHDPKSEVAHTNKALLLSSEAATLCNVERQRINRWEREGRIRRAITTPSGPLFWRVDVLRVKGEEDERGARRSRGVTAEPADA